MRECGVLILTVPYRDCAKQQGSVCATVTGLAVSSLNISLSKMPERGGGVKCEVVRLTEKGWTFECANVIHVSSQLQFTP